MVEEARLEPTEHGLVPQGEGWFVVNAREARWWENDAFGRFTSFQGDVRFPDVGVNIGVLEPGQPACMYHQESNQEDFLVLAGECLLLVEGEERTLRAWDFFHCPAGTEHVIVGAGDGPCAVLALGARDPDRSILYPVAEVAERHGASVSADTTSPKEAYASSPEDRESTYRQGDLPDWR
jgi:uncharacterized cupin superfamily protein